jgi:ribosomal protein S1
LSWQSFAVRHQVGDVVDGVVTAQVPFGSFVEVDECNGLAPQQMWPVGAQVSVKILAIDVDRQRFSVEAV